MSSPLSHIEIIAALEHGGTVLNRPSSRVSAPCGSVTPGGNVVGAMQNAGASERLTR